jgi:hypothetical protein
MLYSAGAAAAGVTCGAESLDNEGADFTATPYCETVITKSLFMTDNLAYRSVGSVGLTDLEVPDTFTFAAIGSGSGSGSKSFSAKSLSGIVTTSELGYMNSTSKNLMADGGLTSVRKCSGPRSLRPLIFRNKPEPVPPFHFFKKYHSVDILCVIKNEAGLPGQEGVSPLLVPPHQEKLFSGFNGRVLEYFILETSRTQTRGAPMAPWKKFPNISTSFTIRHVSEPVDFFPNLTIW